MSGIKILNAVYGSGSKTVDVTSAVASHIQDGELNLTVTPDSLGVENPAPGEYNQLTVTYTINNGDKNTSTTADNGVLMISAPPARKAVGLQIDSAEYGYTGNFTDVTDALRSLVENGSINIKVSPSSVGIPDPNPNKQKQLNVTYSLNGAKNSVTVKDNSYFKISAPEAKDTDVTPLTDHAGSLLGSLFKNAWYFAGAFLYVLSIYSAYDVGTAMGFAMPIAVLAVILPFISFWGLPVYVFVRRLFYTTDLVITSSTIGNGNPTVY